MVKKGLIIVILVGCLIGISTIRHYYVQKYPDMLEPGIILYLHTENKTINMALEDYLVGTVAAEMPASFATEALKAQAVCARTYAIRKMTENHSYPLGADLSDDITTCQAFVDVKNHDSVWKNNPQLLKRVREAVQSTRGEILLYDSEPIDALYHSTCGGRTESGNVYGGTEIPYLQSVKCGYCQESNHYRSYFTVGNEKVNQLYGYNGKDLKLKVIQRSSSGRAMKLSINGQDIYASNFREKLDLPSTWLYFTINNDHFQIEARGYGHGMGMCQYGANGMAKAGKNYQQILKKYYQGIQIYKINY